MKIQTLCSYCGCRLQVTPKDDDAEETTFICPACNEVNALDILSAITLDTTTSTSTNTNTTTNNKPLMTEQLALQQLKMFCTVN